MDVTFGTTLGLVGISLVVLLVVLSALAGLIYLITGWIKGDESEEEELVAAPAQASADANSKEQEMKMKAALIAVAIARSTQGGRARSAEEQAEIGPWHQLHLARRLNQTVHVRRSS